MSSLRHGRVADVKILVGSIPMPMNRFLVDLNQALSTQSELTHDANAFWNMEGDFDVVHLHFPEYLTLEIQESYRSGLRDELIAETEKRLRFWAERSTIVVTRHVLLPHDALENPQWEKMYEMFYRYTHGVVHFAQASIDEFQERYSLTKFFNGPPQHAIVPHHNYASLPNVVSRAEARQRLGIPNNKNVMLVFGSIRNDEEISLILDTFHGLRQRRKLLLVSKWREKLANVSWIRLKYWLRDFNRLYYRLHPSYHFNFGFVEEENTQLYLNAADVLFIPRLKVLNSGNITLGMTFGKVVVGPDSWDVGQLLRETGNPIFDPEQPKTAIASVEEGFRLAEAGHIGSANQKLTLEKWSAEQCGAKYVAFFKRLAAGSGEQGAS